MKETENKEKGKERRREREGKERWRKKEVNGLTHYLFHHLGMSVSLSL